MYTVGAISGLTWLIACGVGLYTTYLVNGPAFFDRVLAASGMEGTIVPIQFIADGSGHVGTIILLLYNTFSGIEGDATAMFTWVSSVAGVFLLASLVMMLCYFCTKLPAQRKPPEQVGAESELDPLTGAVDTTVDLRVERGGAGGVRRSASDIAAD